MPFRSFSWPVKVTVQSTFNSRWLSFVYKYGHESDITIHFAAQNTLVLISFYGCVLSIKITNPVRTVVCTTVRTRLVGIAGRGVVRRRPIMQKKEQAFRTKQSLADALKEELKRKPLNKIRIRELTDHCGIYRQTFYYHFTDLESLLLWAARQDIESLVSHPLDAASWQKCVETLLKDADEYRGYCLAVLDSDAYPEQRKSLQTQIVTLLSAALERSNKQLLLPAQNYVTIFCSIMEQWVRGTLRQTPEEVVRFFTELTGESCLSHTNAPTCFS